MFVNNVSAYEVPDATPNNDEYVEGCKLDDIEWVNSLPQADYSYVRNNLCSEDGNGGFRDTLPTSIDLTSNNSNYHQFIPAIGNQHGTGSCACFAFCYQLTYEFNNYYNITTTSSNTFCPQWNYSILAGGYKLQGTSFYENLGVVESFGTLNYSDYPNNFFDYDPTQANNWNNKFTRYYPNYVSAHYNGLGKRINAYTVDIPCDPVTTTQTHNPTFLTFNTGLASDQAIDPIKEALVAGKVLYVSANSPNTALYKTATNGEYAIVEARDIPSHGKHAMIIVGYDDSIEVDINGDTNISDWERGALKVANSWGDDWKNDGYIWVMYDALNDISNSGYLGFVGSSSYRSSFFSLRIDREYNSTSHYVTRTINVSKVPVYIVGKLNVDTDFRYRYSLNHGRRYKTMPNNIEIGYNLDFGSSSDTSMIGQNYVDLEGSIIIDYYRLFHYYSQIYDGCYPYLKLTPTSIDYSDLVSFDITDNLNNVINSVDLSYLWNSNSTSETIFIDASLQKGDLNYDGVINNLDIALLRSYISGAIDYSNVQLFLADLNSDGHLSSRDLQMLKLLVAGINPSEMTDYEIDAIYNQLFIY